MIIIYYLAFLAYTLYSFLFIDHNFIFTVNSHILNIQNTIFYIAFTYRIWVAVTYVFLMVMLYGFYIYFLTTKSLPVRISKKPVRLLVPIIIILFLSFPAFSYDIFNYMTTAKVAYVHKENPYLVMPVEIPNEPWLGFTRAANKVALYGPTWLLMTWLPLVLGMGNPLLTVYAFKLIPLAGYVCMLVLIQRITREPRNVLFFGLNPLVLTETLVAAHNDIIMMDLAILAILLASSERFTSRITGFVCLIASVFIKGATLILLPLVVLRKRIKVSLFDAGFWLMLFVFFLSPLREELYPWYAVWFLSFAACIPFKKGSFIHYFSIFLSLGLSFRHVPYIVTREYGGVGPLLRLVVTIVPPALYAAFLIMRKKRIQLFPSHG